MPSHAQANPSQSRSVLMLQGPLSDYYSIIGEELERLGANVHRINFCGSDAHNWKLPCAENFTGPPGEWKDFLQSFVISRQVSDIVLHGDRRFYHQVAIEIASQLGVNVIATELGYLRPDWMTIEKGGCSTLSHFPNDPDRIRQIAETVGPRDRSRRFSSSLLEHVRQELSFTFWNRLGQKQFPTYLNHRVEGRSEVYWGWLKAQALKNFRKSQGKRVFSRVLDSRKSFFICALQLNGDFQIREHSPFESMVEALEYMVASFAKNAAPNTLLVIKPHPLEYRYKLLKESASNLECKYGLSGRLHWVDGVSIGKLCERASGFVTLNSSAGFEALEQGCPACTVMPTLYDVVGLTHQEPLDLFWQKAAVPDLTLLEALTDALAGTIQVRGNLYSKEGRRIAAEAAARRIYHRLINEPRAFEAKPPRLRKAQKQGVDLVPWRPLSESDLQPEFA